MPKFIEPVKPGDPFPTAGTSRLAKSPSHEEICRRLTAGISSERIATWLQTEVGEFTDIKYDSLVRNLYRFKSNMPATEHPAAYKNTSLMKRVEALKDAVDEVEEMRKLYLLQLERIKAGVTFEEGLKGMLQKGTKMEVRLAMELLQASVDMKLKMGIYKAAPVQLNLNADIRTESTHILASVPEDQRASLGEAANILLLALTGLPEAQASEAISDAEYEVLSDLKNTDG